jgi:hypothetical protein
MGFTSSKPFTGVIRTGAPMCVDGITHLDFAADPDTCNDISYIARSDFLRFDHAHFQRSCMFGRCFLAGVAELDFVALFVGFRSLTRT